MSSKKKVRYALSKNDINWSKDMSWTIYCCETLRWTGYGDSYFWDKMTEELVEAYHIRACSKCHTKWRVIAGSCVWRRKKRRRILVID